MLCNERFCYDMIMFQVWKGSCQSLLKYEWLENFEVKLYSECDLLFDPLAPPQDLTLSMILQNRRLCYDVIIVQISNLSGQWLLRYGSFKKPLM